MRARTELHEILCDILGSRNVYFEPPESVKLHYPCIVYNFEGLDRIKANNGNYRTMGRYSLTVISTNIGTVIGPVVDRLLELPYSSYGRPFDADGLSHETLDLYF